MENFFIAFYAVIPFLLYLAFGALVQRVGAADDVLLDKLNVLVFQAFFPLLMFKNIYWAHVDFVMNVPFIAFVLVSVIALILLLLLIVPRLVRENPRRGVIVQGMYRSNIALFAIPLAENLYGSSVSLLATLLVAFTIPLYNISAVIVLERFNNSTTSWRMLLRKVATNPLLLGIVAGALCRTLRIPIPDFFGNAMQTFANMATPLALFVLGGTLRFASLRQHAKLLAVITGIKMVLLPLVFFLLSLLFPFEPMERFMILLVFATPVAVSSFTMAKTMGGDGELAGQIVVCTTAVSLGTLFLFIFVLKSLALI